MSRRNSVSWKKYTDRGFKFLQRENDLRAKYERIAAEKLAANFEKRLDGLNEIRGQMKDQQANFVTRKEIEELTKALIAGQDAFGSRLDRSEGRGSGMNQFWVWIVGGLSLLFWGYSVLKPH